MDLKIPKDDGWQLSKNCVQQRLKELLYLSQWTDCSFRVGTDKVEVIHGHKLILAVTSPVFEALFYGPLADEKNQIINVPDIEPHTFHLFLSYIYSDEVNLKSIAEAGELLYVAKKYLVQPLMMNCLCYLVQHTWIRTLWDILYIAEELNEEELFSSCIKIMCHYHYDLWKSEEDNLSASTLCRLLDKEQMNMAESDVLSMLLDWARKDLRIRNREDNPQARRRLLEDIGALKRLRFLALSSQDIDAQCELFTERELTAFRDHKTPEGFSCIAVSREYITPVTRRLTRDHISSRGQVWVNRGEVVSVVRSSSRVLVTGFEVFTRLMQISDYVRTPMANSSYRERLVIFIKDHEGKILQKTDYDCNVNFNGSQCINLVRPFWFESNVKYTISMSFICGQYPLCSFSDAVNKGVKFFFEEMVQMDELNQMSTSFIMSVLYAL